MHVTGGRRLQWHAVAPQAVPAALSVHTGRATPAAATAGRGPGRCCSPRRGSGVMGGRHASGRVWDGTNANAGACHWPTTQSRTQCRAARRARRAGILRGRASLARIQPCYPWGSGARGVSAARPRLRDAMGAGQGHSSDMNLNDKGVVQNCGELRISKGCTFLGVTGIIQATLDRVLKFRGLTVCEHHSLRHGGASDVERRARLSVPGAVARVRERA